MAAAAPRTTLLFADSFRHERLCQHVDEVRFTEPVVITACEVVELQQQSLCPSISLTGCSNPESCAVEIFVRTGGDARFQPLGPAFLHSPAATSFLDVQAAVTEHVVLRGSYKSLTLVIYGNLASELSSDHNLDPDVFLSAEATSLQQHLQDTDTETATVPQSLHLLVPPSTEQVDLLNRLLQCVDPKDTTHQLVPALLAAAAVWHLPQRHAVNSSAPRYAAAAKPGLADGPTAPLVSDASSELVELREWVQQREDEGKVTTGDQEENVLLDLTLHWLRAGLEPSPVLDSQLSTVEMLIGGLAAAQLLCANYADDVSLFLEAGGMGLLLQVVQDVAGTSALLLFALTAIDCACCHGQACEALVSQGKEPLLVLSEEKQQPPVGQLLRRILRRLSVYQIATAFELTVQQLTKESSSKKITAEEAVAIDEVTLLLTELLGALGVKGLTEEDGGVFHDAGFSNMGLLTSSLPGGSITSKASVASEEIDPSVLSLLQERCLVPSLAALISHARLWIVDGKTTAAGVEFLAAIQRLLLHLLRCRPGLLFIGADKKAATAITDGLRLMQNVQEMDVLPFHHVAVLTSVGLLCRPCDLAGMLQSSISVMTAMDRLIGADKGSEAAFGSLWDLAVIARSEAGRQAILAVVQFPEVLAVLMESLNSAPQQPAIAPGEAGMNLAAEVLQKVLWDAAPTTLLAWTRHAPTLQHLLQEACSSEASIFGQILDWVEPAAVFEKKGAVGLLRYAAALIGTQNSSAGSHMDGPLDDDPSNIREHVADTELPTVLSRGLSSPLIYESAMQPLTISLRLLASLSADPGVAAELYGEGGMGVVSAVLEHSVAALQAPLSDYDEEEGEGEEEDGRMEQNKEGALFVMLLPTLLFLQTLLKRLQGAVQQYCNTKLLDMLLRLHYSVSAKPEAYGAVPPYAWTGGVLEVGAVRQVLASIIACWPIFGWTPALLPQLLGSNPTSLPGEPVEACSAICLLEEMLPPAPPILCLEKAAVMDVYRNSAVGLMSGIGVMADVQWHFSLANAQKMLHALGPHLEQLAQLILRLAPSACLLVQERLTHLVIRMSCQSVEHAAVLLNPVISTLQQQTAAATVSLLSEIDALQVERMLQWVSHLAFHPASKVVLLQGGAVQVLVQALVVPADVIRLGWLTWSCKALMALCDPAISFLPMSFIERRLAEDCASFEDCRIIASALSSLFEVMSLGKHSLVLAGVWEKLANHELGRAALASVAVCQQGSVQPSVSQDISDPEPAQPPDRDNPPLLVLWQKISVEFESNKTLRPSLVGVIHHFARGANALSHQGQSACGTWALKAMFGLDLSPGTTEIRVVEDILQPVFNVASSLQELLTDSDQPGEVPNNLMQEAHIAVTAMLHILAAPATEWNIEEQIKAVLEQQETPRPVAERRAEAIPGHSPSRLRILVPDFLGDSELVDLDSYIEVPTIDFRGTIPWECPTKLQEKPHMAISSLKRRPISTIELAGKRQRGEAGAGSPSVRATSAATPNRRDTFRQRKPNTSRPPSMHVDDYVAREKSSDGPTSGSPATAGPSLQRTNSSGGRPPSIHVDEFMARQRERQQSSQMMVQTSVEIVATKTGVDPMEVEDDGAIPGLLGPSHPDQKNAEQGSVTVTSLSTTVLIPPISNSTASFGGAPMHSQVVKTLSNQSNMSSLSTASASDIRNMTLKQFEDIKQEQINRLTHVDSSSEPLVTSVVQKVKIEMESVENKGVGQVQGPLRSYTNSHSTDVSSPTVEKDPKQSHWRSKSVRASEVLASPGSNKSMSPISGEHQQKLQMDTDVKLNPPQPPAPSWSHRPVHPQHVPLLPPPMMSTPYNFSPGSRPPGDLQLGGAVLQAPSGSWREAAPSFSGPPPPPAPPPQSTMQQGPSSLPVPYGSMRPFDGVQAYPLPPSVSSSDHRFVNFAAPMPGQGIPPPPFQPQIPVGRPPVAQVPIPPAQPLHHQPLLQHQPQQPQHQHQQQQPQQPQQQQQPQHQQPQHQQHQAGFNSQQEPAALLQQMLASPDAIQALLKDQNKLRQLLEQHPKLITLLQEKMSSGSI